MLFTTFFFQFNINYPVFNARQFAPCFMAVSLLVVVPRPWQFSRYREFQVFAEPSPWLLVIPPYCWFTN